MITVKKAEKSRNDSGFSLIEIMIAGGLVAGLTLFLAQMFKNSFTVQQDAAMNTDYIELKKEIDFIVGDIRSCKASLAGLTFKGSTILANPIPNVELWYATTTGARSRKLLSSSTKFGKVDIGAVVLEMPDHLAGTDFAPGIDSFHGHIKIYGSKKRGSSAKDFKFDSRTMRIDFSTNASGLSTILSCDTSTTSTDQVAKYKTACEWSAGACLPPVCTPGDIDKGVGCEMTYSLWGGSSGYSGGNCYRTCLSKLAVPMIAYTQMCAVSTGCAPAVCSSGDVDKGVMCVLNTADSGGPTGTQARTCIRQCFTPNPF